MIIKTNLKKGSGLVEILVAVFIFSVIVGSLIAAGSMYLSGAGESLRTAQGAYFAQEGIEAAKIMRDNNWTNLSSLTDNASYYLYWNTASSTNNTWSTTSTATTTDVNFTRTLKTNNVYRDLNGRIVSSGGTLDSNTEKVTVSVSWKSKTATTTKILSTYITNI